MIIISEVLLQIRPLQVLQLQQSWKAMLRSITTLKTPFRRELLLQFRSRFLWDNIPWLIMKLSNQISKARFLLQEENSHGKFFRGNSPKKNFGDCQFSHKIKLLTDQVLRWLQRRQYRHRSLKSSLKISLKQGALARTIQDRFNLSHRRLDKFLLFQI